MRQSERPPWPSHRRIHALAIGMGRHITWNCKDFNHHHQRNINWAYFPSISRSPISRIMDALVYYECHFHISENGIADGMSAEIKICHYKQWESQPAHFNTLKSQARSQMRSHLFSVGPIVPFGPGFFFQFCRIAWRNERLLRNFIAFHLKGFGIFNDFFSRFTKNDFSRFTKNDFSRCINDDFPVNVFVFAFVRLFKSWSICICTVLNHTSANKHSFL